MFSVYMHISPNGKRYIGITKQKPTKRWQNGGGYKNQPFMWKAIKKYSWNNIKHEILFTDLTKEEAEQKEIELIAKYKTTNSRYGYNVSNGGNCLGTLSDVTKEKIRNANLGKSKSEKTREKISVTLTGRKHTEEEKIKISYSLKENRRHCKKVINLNTGKVYQSLSDVAKELNIKNPTHIIDVCRGKRYSAYGYKWSYAKEVM